MQSRVANPIRINSWLIASVLCINTFSKWLSVFVYIPFNIVLMETAVLLLLVLLNNGRVLLKQELIIILLVVAGIMGYSLILWRFDSRVMERLLKFVMYALFAMLCIQYPFDEKELLTAICYIGIIHIAYLFLYAASQIKAGIMSVDNTMDLSYTSLIYLFASAEIAGSKYERKSNRLLALMICAFVAYFITVVSMNRGALIAAASYFAFRVITSSKRLLLRVMCFIGVIIAALIVYDNLIPILEAADEFASSRGVVINPLRKTIQQMNYSDSMISGREAVYGAAVQMIKETWALPNGVASYHIQTNAAYYPHNIFLEACIEFGFVGIILVALIILRACYFIVITPVRRSGIILMFFCMSIPRLMVSSSYWENSYIWPLMMLLWSSEVLTYQKNNIQGFC